MKILVGMMMIYFDSQIEIKTAILSLSLHDYSDACIHVKGTIIVPIMTATGAAQNKREISNT